MAWIYGIAGPLLEGMLLSRAATISPVARSSCSMNKLPQHNMRTETYAYLAEADGATRTSQGPFSHPGTIGRSSNEEPGISRDSCE